MLILAYKEASPFSRASGEDKGNLSSELACRAAPLLLTYFKTKTKTKTYLPACTQSYIRSRSRQCRRKVIILARKREEGRGKKSKLFKELVVQEYLAKLSNSCIACSQLSTSLASQASKQASLLFFILIPEPRANTNNLVLFIPSLLYYLPTQAARKKGSRQKHLQIAPLEPITYYLYFITTLLTLGSCLSLGLAAAFNYLPTMCCRGREKDYLFSRLPLRQSPSQTEIEKKAASKCY